MAICTMCSPHYVFFLKMIDAQKRQVIRALTLHRHLLKLSEGKEGATETGRVAVAHARPSARET